MKPYATGRGWTLYHADCRAVLPGLAGVDAVVTDPPYGVGIIRGDSRIMERITGDDAPPDIRWIGERDAIVWGGNNFCDQLPRSTGWLIWDKWESQKSRHSMAEIAWCNVVNTVRVHRQSFRGFTATDAHDSARVHPCQKPLQLMKWCLGFLDEGRSIFDPFTGSGSTGVAALATGRPFVGIEIDERWCEVAARRLQRAEEDTALFAEAKTTTPETPALFEESP